MSNPADNSDDLIAELAKLMADEAQGDRPAPQEATAPRLVSDNRAKTGQGSFIRIPGEDRPVIVAQPEAQAPAPVQPEAAEFDFGLAAKLEPVAHVETKPQAQRAPEVLPEPSVASTEPHDAIGELIAAEFAVAPQPAPQVEEPAPAPAAIVARAPEPEAVEPAPVPTPQVAAPVQSAPAPEPAPQTASAPPAPPRAAGAQVNIIRPTLRQVTVPTQRRPDADNFVIAPVVGLGTGRRVQPEAPPARHAVPPVPQPPAPPVPARREPSFASGSSDALAEIESLIGEAVRVEVDKPIRQPVAAVPPIPPAPASGLPRKSAIKAPKHDVASLDEEAILAAAAVSGSEVATVSADEDDGLPVIQDSRPRRGIGRALLGPAVALTLLGGAGYGLYWALNSGVSNSEAPVLVADTSPTRQPVVEASVSNQQRSVVFDEIDGVTTPASAEQLVPRDQTEVAEVTTPALDAPPEQGLANRRVRTVTVRPDGTIVSGDETLAANNVLPVERPNVPELPAIASVDAANLLGGATGSLPPNSPVQAFAPSPDGSLSTPSAVETPATDVAALSSPSDAAALPPAIEPAPESTALAGGVEATVITEDGVTSNNAMVPIPMPRPQFRETATPVSSTSTPTAPINAVVEEPVDLVANLAALEAQQTAAPEPATQTAATQPAVNTAPAYIQLSSQRTEQAAMDTMSVLQNRYGSLFQGATMEVQRVDLGDRGVYYRVRLPASSLSSANQVCSNIKNAGGDCFTL